MQSSQSFEGIISGYEVKIVASGSYLQFLYSIDAQPHIPYQAVFTKQINGSTSPQACSLIINYFKTFKRCLAYIQNFQQDERRMEILDGQFSIWFFKTKRKPRKCPLIRFQGAPLLDQYQKKEERRVEQEIEVSVRENRKLKSKVRQMQRQCQEQRRVIRQLSRMILKSDRDYLKYLKRDTELLDSEQEWRYPQKKLRIQSFKNQIGQMRKLLFQLSTKVQNKQSSKPSKYRQQQQFDFLQRYGMRHWVVIDMNNRFIVDNYEIDNHVLKKIGRYGKYQVLGRDPFPSKGRHFFSVYLNKITHAIFSIGVVNQNQRNHQFSYESSQCISFFAREGTVWQDGVCRGGGPPIRDGVQIKVVVDLLKQLIKWYRQDVEIASTNIGKHLLNVRLVPMILLNYPGDYVTFNYKPEVE